MSILPRQVFRIVLCPSYFANSTASCQRKCTISAVMCKVERNLSSNTSSNIPFSLYPSSTSPHFFFKPNPICIVPKMQNSLQANTGVKNDDVQSIASTDENLKPSTYLAKLKQAATQYGSTVMVFHVTISLISLGTCYTIIASGVDMSAMLEKIGLSENAVNKLATSSGTFAAAYLVHKVLMPIRVSITLACTPFIVRYLRKIGFIRKPSPTIRQNGCK